LTNARRFLNFLREEIIMELLFADQVRSSGRRIGYLAGVELDARSRRVTKIIFSKDGKLGSDAHTRSIDAVRIERGSVIVDESLLDQPATTEPLLLSRSVRITKGGRHSGHLAGVVVGDQATLAAAIGKQHWWTGRYRLPASDLDFSQPGEIRTGASGSRAA
jgi:hypothetical protein